MHIRCSFRLFHGLKCTSPNIHVGLFRLAYVHTRHLSISHLPLSNDSLKQLRCFLLWFPESSGAWNHNLNKHFTFLSSDNMLSFMASLCLFSYLQPHTRRRLNFTMEAFRAFLADPSEAKRRRCCQVSLCVCFLFYSFNSHKWIGASAALKRFGAGCVLAFGSVMFFHSQRRFICWVHDISEK